MQKKCTQIIFKFWDYFLYEKYKENEKKEIPGTYKKFCRTE